MYNIIYLFIRAYVTNCDAYKMCTKIYFLISPYEIWTAIVLNLSKFASVGVSNVVARLY